MCQELLKNDTVCSNPEHHKGDEEVQTTASYILLLFSATLSLVSIPPAIMLGSWSDRAGRRWVMALPSVLSLLSGGVALGCRLVGKHQRLLDPDRCCPNRPDRWPCLHFPQLIQLPGRPDHGLQLQSHFTHGSSRVHDIRWRHSGIPTRWILGARSRTPGSIRGLHWLPRPVGALYCALAERPYDERKYTYSSL